MKEKVATEEKITMHLVSTWQAAPDLVVLYNEKTGSMRQELWMPFNFRKAFDVIFYAAALELYWGEKLHKGILSEKEPKTSKAKRQI